MHITFPLVLVWAAVQFGFLSQRGFSISGAAFGVVVTLLLFACVVIHELSHSLTAIRMGFPVREIVLLPLGGVAQIERMPERPGQELLMAIAGPISNVIIAGILIVFGLAAGADLGRGMLNVLTDPTQLGFRDIVPYLVFTNISLAVFNLIPAFPMDGGRVLRAVLATVVPHARATAIAVFVGQGLAWLLGLAGLLSGNLLWILIAVFIYAGAAQEGRLIRVRDVLQGLRVRHAFSHGGLALAPDEPVSHAADLTFESFQADFPVCAGAVSSEGGPVCDSDSLVGLLTYTDIVRALKQRQPETPVGDVMRTSFPTVGLDEELFEVQQQMAQAGLDVLPVIDGGLFLGLLTRRDVNEVYQLLSVSPELLTGRQAS
jgi:Zn-dependent protease/CBS domain-containing protein